MLTREDPEKPFWVFPDPDELPLPLRRQWPWVIPIPDNPEEPFTIPIREPEKVPAAVP